MLHQNLMYVKKYVVMVMIMEIINAMMEISSVEMAVHLLVLLSLDGIVDMDHLVLLIFVGHCKDL